MDWFLKCDKPLFKPKVTHFATALLDGVELISSISHLLFTCTLETKGAQKFMHTSF